MSLPLLDTDIGKWPARADGGSEEGLVTDGEGFTVPSRKASCIDMSYFQISANYNN